MTATVSRSQIFVPVFFSYESAVLPANDPQWTIATVNLELAELVAKNQDCLKKTSPTTEEIQRYSLIAMLSEYEPKPCRHIARIKSSAKGTPTEIPNLYFQVEGQPACILCGTSVDYCPRCCEAELSRHKLLRWDSWGDLTADEVAFAMHWPLILNRVIDLAECHQCGFIWSGGHEDSNAYLK